MIRFCSTLLLICLSFATLSVQQITAQEKATTSLMVGQTLPDFYMPDKNNQQIALSSMQDKYVLVHFWASWCPCSQPKIPNYVLLHDKYKQANFADASGFEVYSVSLDDNETEWLEAVDKYGMNWAANTCDLRGFNSPVVKAFDVNIIPTALLLSPDREILAVNPELYEIDGILSAKAALPGPEELALVVEKLNFQAADRNPATVYQQKSYASPSLFQNSRQQVNNSTLKMARYKTIPQQPQPQVDNNMKIFLGSYDMVNMSQFDAIKDMADVELLIGNDGKIMAFAHSFVNKQNPLNTLTAVRTRGYYNAYIAN